MGAHKKGGKSPVRKECLYLKGKGHAVIIAYGMLVTFESADKWQLFRLEDCEK